MNKLFSAFVLWAFTYIPKRKFSNITFWKHANGSYLYICMSAKYIKKEEIFIQMFEHGIRISQTEFNAIHYFKPVVKIVYVGDDNIMDEHFKTEEPAADLKKLIE